jgi:Protein of unknown function (DUF1214)
MNQMKVNADGSVDLYVGPNAPAGLESNWIPTMGKEPYLWLRLYAPEEAFWTKAFKMPDVELMNWQRTKAAGLCRLMTQCRLQELCFVGNEEDVRLRSHGLLVLTISPPIMCELPGDPCFRALAKPTPKWHDKHVLGTGSNA